MEFSNKFVFAALAAFVVFVLLFSFIVKNFFYLPSDPNLCYKVSDKDQHKDRCLNKAAKNSQNPLFCEQITETEIRDNCFTHFAIKRTLFW